MKFSVVCCYFKSYINSLHVAGERIKNGKFQLRQLCTIVISQYPHSVLLLAFAEFWSTPVSITVMIVSIFSSLQVSTEIIFHHQFGVIKMGSELFQLTSW